MTGITKGESVLPESGTVLFIGMLKVLKSEKDLIGIKSFSAEVKLSFRLDPNK